MRSFVLHVQYMTYKLQVCDFYIIEIINKTENFIIWKLGISIIDIFI